MRTQTLVSPLFLILKALMKGETRFSQIIASGVKKPTLAVNLTKLEERGFVKRRVDGHLKPAGVFYSITEDGKRFYEEMAKEIRSILDGKVVG